jgi:hypothetical protein
MLYVLAAVMIGEGVPAFSTGFSKHKSEAEIARMTPQELVEEYCREYIRHRYDVLDAYYQVLQAYIGRDPVKAMHPLALIIDQYDPSTAPGGSKSIGNSADAARELLFHLDQNVIRLRASEEGRQALESIRRLLRRMEAAHFDTADSSEHWTEGRYRLLLTFLKEWEGINECDRAVRNTLKLKHRIELSDQALPGFVTYLIAKDPRYPGWSERENYRDLAQRNDAGYPKQYFILKNPEPFCNAYLEYQARAKPPMNP